MAKPIPNFAKVGVERSNRFTRSILSKVSKPRFAGAFVFSGVVEIARRGNGGRERGYHTVTCARNRGDMKSQRGVNGHDATRTYDAALCLMSDAKKGFRRCHGTVGPL